MKTIENILKKIKEAPKEVSGNKMKYVFIPGSYFLTAVSLLLLSFFIIKTLINLIKNQENKFISLYLVSLILGCLVLNLSFLYYQDYKIENKVKLNEKSTNEALKKLYENNDYLKIKKLSQIRWASRILILALIINLSIIIKMGSKNQNFKDALIPALFLLFVCFIFIAFNNFLSHKIHNDTEIFDKKIRDIISGSDFQKSSEDFKIFNQLMLERDGLTKTIHVNSFDDSINDKDSTRSFLQKLCLFLSSMLGSISEALKNLAGEKSLDHKDKKIEENLRIFNSIQKVVSEEAKDSPEVVVLEINDDRRKEIKDLNKKSGLLKESDSQNYFFKMIDAVHVHESFYKLFS